MALNKIVLLLSISLLVSCSRTSDQTGLELFPDMVHAVPYEASSESNITKDGKSMLEPPEGSIARGHIPFEFGSGESEAIRAGETLVNPMKITTTSIARGKHVYDNYCLVCHGEKGKGDGPLIPKFPNPPSLTGKRLTKYKDGRFMHIITRGAGDMPAHEAQINMQDRWHLVNYIKELQGRN